MPDLLEPQAAAVSDSKVSAVDASQVGSGAADSAQAGSAVPQQAATTPGQATSGQPSSATQATQAAPAAPAAPAVQGVREQLASLGWDASSFASESDVIPALLSIQQRQHQQLQEQRQLAALGQRWLQQQQAAQEQAAAEPAKPKNWWTLPEFDPSLMEQVTQDDSGKWIPKPGAPFDAAAKVNAYAQELMKVQRQFWQDPRGMLEPHIRELVKEEAANLVKSQFGLTQATSYIQGWESQNSEWLHQRNAQGQVIGYSPVGQQLLDYVQQLKADGISDPLKCLEYAKRQLMADLQSRQSATPAASPQQQQQTANQQFIQQRNPAPLASGQRAPNHLATTAAANGITEATNGIAKLSLKEKLRAEFAANGYTDGLAS